MKKIIYLIIVVLIALAASFVIYFDSEPVIREITDIDEISNLKENANIDILVNMGNYSKNDYNEAALLEAGMRIAQNEGLVKEANDEMYLEYVLVNDLHEIIYELTGIKITKPIEIEDFYYKYDSSKEYYYIVPIGTDWVWVDNFKSIYLEGTDKYIINCSASASSMEYSHKIENIELKLKYMPNNKYVKYQLISINSTERIFEEVYQSYSVNQYGVSELGKSLIYYSLAPEIYTKTVLLNFAIHGYEDNYPKDGEVLVDIANSLIEYYASNIDKLGETRLIVIPCANPDGLYDGTTNNGFGRCNANGVDLNRDFDAEHIVYTNSRNKTSAPFSASESCALRDLVIDINKPMLGLDDNPNIVIDFHGWLNTTIGDDSLAQIFKDNLDLSHQTKFNNKCHGYFAYWAHLQGMESLLVEFKDENIPFDKLIIAIDDICNK